MSLNRREVVGALGAVLLSGAVEPSLAQAGAKAKPVAKLASRLRIVIPANPGGGWDQTGRALGASMLAAGMVDELEFENKGGKGGTIGLAHYADKYGDDANTLLMGGTVMVGAVALQRPAVDLARVQPVARLTSDYLVVVVASDSPIRNVSDLVARMRTNAKAVPVAGGSAGGVDHMFVGVFAKGAGSDPADVAYQPFASGAEVVAAVLSGKAMAGVSGYSEFSEQLANGKLRAIGISARRPVYGIPAIRDQGVDIDMANWRGVFTGQAVTSTRRAEMVEAVRRATGHASWQKTLKQNHWESSWLAGAGLDSFIDFDLTTARVMVHLLKLKA